MIPRHSNVLFEKLEDTKNKAVRVDIPGLKDIQTVIVRMNQNKVQIQAVGSGETAKLFENQGMIKALLARRNVAVDKIQVFDANQMQQRQAA